MEIVGQGAGERADQVVAPVLPEFYVENLDFEHVAGRGALDRNRPGQDMAGHHALVLGMDLGKLRRDVKLGPVRHHLGTAADGVDGDFIAAGDGQDRLQFGLEESPVAGCGAGVQMVMRHEEALVGAGDWVVIAGLDPAIHLFEDAFLRRVMDTRVKPAYDAALALQGNLKRCFLCFPKRSAFMLLPSNFLIGLGIVGLILTLTRFAAAWPQARLCEHRTAGHLRILAAWKLAALSAGTAISAVGCDAGRARRHRGAGRIDRSRAFGRPRRDGVQRRGRPHHHRGRSCPSISQCPHRAIPAATPIWFRTMRRRKPITPRRCSRALAFPRTA